MHFDLPNVIFTLKHGFLHMGFTSLQDDLLNDFKEQKRLIVEQIELFDPLATTLRKPAAQRLVSKGALIFAEVLCYLLALGAVAFAVFLNKLYPFYILSEIRVKPEFESLGNTNMQLLQYSIYALIGIISLLFYFMARAMRHLRLKNDILHLAGKNIKELVGQHLRRKASIDAIEQRHFIELPEFSTYRTPVKVNEVPNPGFDEEAI